MRWDEIEVCLIRKGVDIEKLCVSESARKSKVRCAVSTRTNGYQNDQGHVECKTSDKG